jgi:uncharacterized membrane protein
MCASSRISVFRACALLDLEESHMRAGTLLLAFVFSSGQALAEGQQPIAESIDAHAAQAAVEQGTSTAHRGKLFWPGIALGVAGATTAVLAVTTLRVEDRSTGNAPKPTYQACVAQKTDPIYATNQCDALKGRNSKLLWSGVAVGVVGAVFAIGGMETRAELEKGAVRLVHRIRF